MQEIQTSRKRVATAVMAALVLLGLPAAARADDGPSIETKIKLINSMVEHGVLARDKADVMIREAQGVGAEAAAPQLTTALAATEPAPTAAAAVAVAASQPVADDKAAGEFREQIKRELRAEMKAEMGEDIKRELVAEMKAQMSEDIKRQVLAELTGAGVAGASTAAAATGKPVDAAGAAPATKPHVVRVPYIPESMRREIREQLKQEVLAQAQEERWANPGTLPGWLDRFQFEGDVRLRSDTFRLGKDNTPAGYSYISDNGYGNLTRAADLVGANGAYFGMPNVNTQDDFNRTRLRLRFGAKVKVADTVTGGFLISTGSTSGPTSTNQTMGQGFNKYTLNLDRGYLTLHPVPWLSLTGGRIANPFFSTDLVWADDLNFEGFAATYARPLTPEFTGFATAGLFPLRTDNPMQTSSRDLRAVQVGFNWRFMPTADFKLGAALYDYHGMEGQLEDPTRYGYASDYGSRYEYPAGLRQRGNTLFYVNAASVDTALNPTYWGLASGFREANLTGAVDLAKFDPVHVVLNGDFVKNLAFDRAKIAARTGSTLMDGKDYGYMAKMTVGYPTMMQWGDWNVSLAYRWLGSDAVLDAFTNSDFGMGGTNNKGYILGGSFAIDKNAWISARWMASQQIDSYAPKVVDGIAPTKLSVDLFQLDLNAKF